MSDYNTSIRHFKLINIDCHYYNHYDQYEHIKTVIFMQLQLSTGINV